MKVETCQTSQQAHDLLGPAWDWSRTQPALGWWDALPRGLKYKPFFLVAQSNCGAKGCLPLMLVQSFLFGKFLVSLPYLNSGGLLLQAPNIPRTQIPNPQIPNQQADLPAPLCDLGNALVNRAIELADTLDVKHLELRHESPFPHPAFNAERNDKVHMRLALPSDAATLMANFKSKLRSQIKKASENPFEVRFGTTELLQGFYDVFAENMRDLGTPVYSKNLFRQVLNAFSPNTLPPDIPENTPATPNALRGQAELCVVYLNSTPAAAALLIHHLGKTEVPSASALRRFNATGANMWMYSKLLDRAIEHKSQLFDFGRSSIGSGTYKFKEQWGAKPHPATWQYYVRKGNPADMRPDSANKQKLIRLWQKLPITVTRWFGPSVVRGIP